MADARGKQWERGQGVGNEVSWEKARMQRRGEPFKRQGTSSTKGDERAELGGTRENIVDGERTTCRAAVNGLGNQSDVARGGRGRSQSTGGGGGRNSLPEVGSVGTRGGKGGVG